MSRAVIFATCALACGCATIIGASFDDTTLLDAAATSDASATDAVFQDAPNDAAAPFTPASIANLLFWVDATRGVDVASDAGGPVTRWHDLSAFAHDAVPIAQGTNPPTLVPNQLNGLPVVHFTQAQLDALGTTFQGPNAPNITMFVVTRGDPNSALRFQTTAGAYPFVIFPYDATQDAGPVFELLVGTPQQTYSAVRMEFDGGASVADFTWSANGTCATYSNGALVDQLSFLNPAIPTNQTLYLGGVVPLLPPSTTVPFMNGDLAEAIVYASVLDDADRQAVEGYLKTKWGIFP